MELTRALAHWPQDDFQQVLKLELEALPAEELPLQQALRQAACVSGRPFTATIYSTSDDPDYICARVGIMFNGVVSGCSCADDPSPELETNEYCLLQLRIAKANAQTVVKQLEDEE